MFRTLKILKDTHMSKFVIHPNLRVLHLCNSVMHLPTIHIAKSVMRLDQKNEHQNNTKTIHSCVDVFIYFVLASQPCHGPIAKKIINQLVDNFSFGPNRRSNPLGQPISSYSLAQIRNIHLAQVHFGYKDINPHTHVQPTYT